MVDRPLHPVVEAHVLNFTGDLYDRRLRLLFAHRLRAEQRFPSLDALRAQIAADIAQAEAMLQYAPRTRYSTIEE